jgi:hypothetical protein
MLTVGKLLDQIRRLEIRRRQILTGLRLPPEGLPGSLAQSGRRCGSPGCHCHQGDPHLSWTLTFMVDGKKQVEHVPNELLDAVRARLQEGNAYKSDVAELMAINAQLLLLGRRARKQQEAAAKRGESR